MNVENPLLKLESYKVPAVEKEIRLSDFVPGIFKTIRSKKGMKNAIKKGLVKVNGDRGYTADYIRGGEIIELYQSQNQIKRPVIELQLEVVYEDDHLAIVNKPAGIVVSGNKKWTLQNALENNLAKSSQDDALQRPEPIHRLDYATSGAVLIGKTSQAVTALNKLFEERKVEKTYHAVTIGVMNERGIVKTKVDNKSAETEYMLLHKLLSPRFTFLNLTELKARSGRRHQIRIHMSEIGNPILGDTDYGKEGLILKGKGLFLHASSLQFRHPISRTNLIIRLPLPKKFKKLFPEEWINES